MKVVALVSGGKDSCFSMVLARHHGHEVVALANLLPAAPEVDDLDSYMYQTVGHQVVAAYAACMGLPLYRRRITGASRDQRLVYEDTEGDEVEDLAALLAFVQAEIPGVAAVASGAIASDYQRTRVERVASRLGLVSLAYLWHQPQDPLLQRMIDGGIEAVLVKVAAAGLRPDRHLGASLAAVQPTLRALRDRFGCNVCGEGGEYETLTLDCPLFTRGRLVLDAWEAVAVAEDAVAPVGLLHPTEFHVEPKGDGEGGAEGPAAAVVEVPDDFMAPRAAAAVPPPPGPESSSTSGAPYEVRLRRSLGGACVTVAGEVAGRAADFAADPEATAAALGAALQEVAAHISELNLGWQDALFVHLYVPAMAHFGAANAAYACFLPAINPPARACVQLAPAASGPALVAEVLLRRPAPPAAVPLPALDEKKVLHVQSISEWAPSCIGPYSQAVAHRGLVYFAGQIPLDPPSMAVAPGAAATAAARSLRSCQAVAVAVRTDLPRAALWWTIYTSAAAGTAGRAAAGAALGAFMAGGLAALGDAEGAPSDKSSDGNSDSEEEFVDEYLLPPDMGRRQWAPPTTFVEMPELPRGVQVEVQPVAWSAFGVADDSSSSSSSSSEPRRGRGRGPQDGRPRWVAGLQDRRRTAGEAELCAVISPGDLFRGTAFVASAADPPAAAAAAVEALREEMAAGLLAPADVVSVKIYVPPGAADAAEAVRGSVEAGLGHPGAAVLIPVLRVGPDPEAASAFAVEIFARK